MYALHGGIGGDRLAQSGVRAVGEQSTEVIRPTTRTTRSARPCMVPPNPTVSTVGTDPLTTVDPPPTLLLDLEPDAEAVMASQLRHAGFETHIATSGPSALLAIRTLRFGRSSSSPIWPIPQSATIFVRSGAPRRFLG